MKLKTKFKIISVVIIGLVLAIGSFVFIQVQKLEVVTEENRTASEIMKGVFELNLLASDYLLHPGERNQEQWQLKHQSVEELLQSDILSEHTLQRHSEEQTSLDNLRQDHGVIQTTFLKLTEESISPELKERLVAELLVKSQTMLSSASRLMEVSRTELSNIQQSCALFIMISIAILTGVILSALAVQARSILGPILSLQKGAEIIGAGNLKYRIDIKRQDEIGALAESFNNMSQKLKESYAGLEAKVKQRTEELAESLEQVSHERDKTDAILHSIGDGVFVIDKDYKIALLNQVGAALSGFNIKEALGKNYGEILKFVYEKTGEINDKFVKEAMTTGEVAEMSNDTLLVRKDGSKIPVADSAAPLKDKEGKVIGCVVVFRDISKEREVKRMKDEFISVASHELRTPMTAISGFASMILSGVYGPVNEKLKEPLADIMEGSDRLIKLVSDMLNVSRIEVGRLKFELTSLDLSKLVDDVVTSLEPVAQEKGISLSFKDAEVPLVQADADKAKQILNNLIGNSLKFTDKSGSITVSLTQDGNFVKADISDTGIGIAQEDQDKLFQKFTQIASQENGKPKGTGLGLYISSELAKKMGGQLWIESSQVGKGSTFAFSLPLADTEEAKKIFEGIQKERELHPDQK